MSYTREKGEELRQIEKAIEAQRALEGILSAEQLQPLLNALLAKREILIADLAGSGALAQGINTTAIGEKGQQINAAVQGDVLASGARKEIRLGAKEAPTAESLRAAYLSRVFENTSQLSLAGIDPKAASTETDARLSLAAVYISLGLLRDDPSSQYKLFESRLRSDNLRAADVNKRMRWHDSALEALNDRSRLVLLGDPGSGKSTFVNFVAMCMAGEALKKPKANLRTLDPLPKKQHRKLRKNQWNHGALLPIKIVLRDFVARGFSNGRMQGNAELLWEYICDELKAAALADYIPYLYRELLENKCLLLLDGLDEVPEASSRRIQIQKAVVDFSESFHNCRILITSRTYAYRNQGYRLPSFDEEVLAPFSRKQITRFVERWYTHISELRGISRADARGRAQLLKTAIVTNDRLESLGQRPLLLTLMASLHAWRGGSLPEKREELYADAVNLLLDWWESPKIVRDERGKMVVLQSSLAEWLKIDKDKVRDLLNELAFQAHSSQPDLVGTADIPEDSLVGGLLRLSKNPSVNPGRLVEYLSQRAGLLIPKGVGVYTFPHRTFQEYLAACYLTDHEYPDKLVQLAVADPDRWREVLLLAGAKASRGSTFAFWALVQSFCHKPNNDSATAGDIWGAHLAAQILIETADLRKVSGREQSIVELVHGWQVDLLNADCLPETERILAGDHLEVLGDPRFRSDQWFLPAESTLGFVKIPAGEFWMGSDPAKDSACLPDERPQHLVMLPDFYLSRYPVTVAQFQAFVDDSGYVPSHKASLSSFGNRPVILITWTDAIAYCEWLTENLRRVSGTLQSLAHIMSDEAWVVTLPTEAQWEKAARGGIVVLDETGDLAPNTNPQRIFPWGNAFEPGRARVLLPGTRPSSSTVGSYKKGASIYGILDLSGNVWEWTRSHYSKYPYEAKDGREDLAKPDLSRVMRGGTHATGPNVARCASRVRGSVKQSSTSRGFRTAISLSNPKDESD